MAESGRRSVGLVSEQMTVLGWGWWRDNKIEVLTMHKVNRNV